MAESQDDLLPPRAEVPPEHRRRWLVATLVAVVVSVALLTGGPWVFARMIADPPPEPLTLTEATPEPPAVPAEPAPGVDGPWQVGAGSQAGYRLGEVLSGQSLHVVGRTEQVTGSVTIADGVLSAARVVVDTSSIATDEAARDTYFRRALDTSTYPEAVFELTSSVDLGDLDQTTEPRAYEAGGVLTIRDVTIPVTVALSVQRTAAGTEVVGSFPVALADLGLIVPDLGFVTVDSSGVVEMRLVLVR